MRTRVCGNRQNLDTAYCSVGDAEDIKETRRVYSLAMKFTNSTITSLVTYLSASNQPTSHNLKPSAESEKLRFLTLLRIVVLDHWRHILAIPITVLPLRAGVHCWVAAVNNSLASGRPDPACVRTVVSVSIGDTAKDDARSSMRTLIL